MIFAEAQLWWEKFQSIPRRDFGVYIESHDKEEGGKDYYVYLQWEEEGREFYTVRAADNFLDELHNRMMS